MALQVRLNNTNVPFVLFGNAAVLGDATLLQDAGRATALVFGTVMAKVAASQKWVPFTDETATTGAAIPQGIYVGPSVAAADLVAGDVTDAPIMVGLNVMVDENQIVIENSKTLDTVIETAPGEATCVDLRTVRDRLASRGILCEDTIDISSFENT